MSSAIGWIAAEADEPGDVDLQGFTVRKSPQRAEDGHRSRERPDTGSLIAHQFPVKGSESRSEIDDDESQDARTVSSQNAETRVGQPEAGRPEDVPGQLPTYQDPEDERRRRIYRGRTVGMLRRYMRYSIETGRLPSLLGREFFRTQVTSYTVVTFEDRVIFVHDMEICLDRLDEFSRQVLTRIVMQEYEHEQAARLLGCTRMTVHRKLLEALDTLSNMLLEVGLLDTLSSSEQKSCQGGKTDDFSASDSNERK